MAKPDWGELQQRFLSEHATTGVSPKEWCESQGLNYATARRYIKKPTAQKSAQERMHAAQKDKSTDELVDIKLSAKVKRFIAEYLKDNIHFKSLTDSIDTSSPMGRFIFHIMSALAEMERELIVERTRAGLAAARAKGRIGGRRPKLTQEQWDQAGRLIAKGVDRRQVAIIYDVAVCTLYKNSPLQNRLKTAHIELWP